MHDGDRDGAAVGGVPYGVGEEVVDDLSDPVDGGPGHHGRGGIEAKRHAPVGDLHPRGDALPHVAGEIDRFGRGGAGIGPGEREERVNEPGYARDLGGGGVETSPARVVHVSFEVLQLQAQSRQRSAELVRGVGDEIALGPYEPVHTSDHVVELERQVAKLGRSVGHRGSLDPGTASTTTPTITVPTATTPAFTLNDSATTETDGGVDGRGSGGDGHERDDD
jgi:hypothetical protein